MATLSCRAAALVKPNGQRIRQSTGTEDRREAEALLAKLKVEAFREPNFGIKPQRSWHEAVKPGNQPATVNRYLATIRKLLRIARDE
jgi:hypothetical protein